LHALLSQDPPRPLGLAGLGGIGKTQLAVEYAYRHKTYYPDGIFWFNAAGSAVDWQKALTELALSLGLRVADPGSSDYQLRLVAELAGYLNQHSRTLLVLDNVEDPAWLTAARVQAFIPAALACRVLFTTRLHKPGLPFAWLGVGMLPEAEALDLLLKSESRKVVRNLIHPEHSAACELCALLGYHPLALEVAGAYLERFPSISLPGYLKRMQEEGGLSTIDDT